MDCMDHGVANSQTRMSNFHFTYSSVGEESACNEGDHSSIPGLGRFPGEGNTYLLQYSGLKNSMDCIVHQFSSVQFSHSVMSDSLRPHGL